MKHHVGKHGSGLPFLIYINFSVLGGVVRSINLDKQRLEKQENKANAVLYAADSGIKKSTKLAGISDLFLLVLTWLGSTQLV